MTTPPFVGGFDFAGTVEAAGAESGFEKGQQVFGDVSNMKETSPYVDHRPVTPPPRLTRHYRFNSLLNHLITPCVAPSPPDATAQPPLYSLAVGTIVTSTMNTTVHLTAR